MYQNRENIKSKQKEVTLEVQNNARIQDNYSMSRILNDKLENI